MDSNYSSLLFEVAVIPTNFLLVKDGYFES